MKMLSVKSLLLILLLAASPTLRADAPVLWGVTGVGGSASSLYAINPKTGQAMRVGAVGRNNVSGISVHPTTKVLYGTQGNKGGTQSLLVINKTRGSAATIGEIGEAIADSAFSPAGELFVYGASTRNLSKVNLGTGATTLVKSNALPFGACGLTFDKSGALYATRFNSIIKLNPANGDTISSAVIGGATPDVDNLLTMRSDGVIFAGIRDVKAAPTRLFTINPDSGATTAVRSVPLALSGMTFDTAPTPGFKISGPKLRKTRKPSAILRGTYTSNVPGTITHRKSRLVTKNGPWKLTVSKLRPGSNLVRVRCVDAVGQTRTATVRIVREN